VLIQNAPAGSLAGPQREGSTPRLDLLKPGVANEARAGQN
jgi:hypothetical protein